MIYIFLYRSRCGGGVAVAEDASGIRPVCLRDLQPGIPERPEPPDAPAPPQGAVEIVEERDAGSEEAGFRVPGADVPAPRPVSRAWRPRRHQETLPPEAQQPQAMGLRPLLQGLCRTIRL